MTEPRSLPLRPALPADLPAIEALIADSYGPWVARIGVRPGPLDDDYAALIAAGRILVLDEAGALQALLVLVPEPEPAPGAMLLDNLAVARAAQGRGLGRALVAEAETRARALRLPVLRLYTHARMESNIALYQRLGFAITERRIDKGLDRVFMAKPL
ncbi:GNAT family N-acetyltransferase [Frigidibacter sp. MR17.14]|uniref:GNAT family N-acetyltransferase n=1 Tax=Frigidibacter sp. MR17.14 TaxID=3126509 RepID=UPI003012EE83